jgi:hypothetical protein
VALAAAFVGLSSAPLCAQTTIASWNFNTANVGAVNVDNPVTDFILALPSSSLTVGPTGGVGGALSGSGASGDVGAAVVGEINTLGASGAALFSSPGNKFLRIFDRDTGTGASDNVSLRLDQALTGTTPVQMLSFDFRSTQYNTATASQASGLFLAISLNDALIPGANSASTVNNAARIEIFRFDATNARLTTTSSNAATGGLTSNALTTNLDLLSVNTLKVVVNDSESSAPYTFGSISGTVIANSYAVWVNNTLFTNDRLMRSNHTGGTEAFSRFALGTTNGNGSDWAIDNISVTGFSAIPEPTTFASLAGLGAIGMVALRRRRRVA